MKGLAISVIASSVLLMAEDYSLDTMSVTATKLERKSSEVSQSITVIDSEKIEDRKLLGISEALKGIPGVVSESKNGGYDTRLIIRGAGLKANYGVREIMVLRDGVPLTDPDSFTRLDFVDTQDIERVEVTKGPGSIFAAGTSGGVVQILSKSVFDEGKNRFKVGIGNDGARSTNLRYGGAIDDANFYTLTFSHRGIDNNWRENNNFSTYQGSLKYGHLFDDGSAFEGEFSLTKAMFQLPPSMDDSEFETFKKDGKQPDTSTVWHRNGRNSNVYFLNLKYEKEFENFTFKPRVYANKWDHYHPVPGMINESPDNKIYGTDLEINNAHSLFGNPAQIVMGVTGRVDSSDGSKKYKYSDDCLITQTTTSWSGTTTTILESTCDDKGELSEEQNSKTTLQGIYAQESLNIGDKWLVDVGLRVDKTTFDIEGYEFYDYNWGTTSYTTGGGAFDFNKDYSLISQKLGVSYKLTPMYTLYASYAKSDQTPSESEVRSNITNNGPELHAPKSVNYEVGVKARNNDYAFDIALYSNPVDEEIVSTYQNSQTLYQNAGKTDKKGMEFDGTYFITKHWNVGASYAYNEYKYEDYTEIVYGATTSNIDRSGNYLPNIPMHQYNFSVAYFDPSGWRTRVDSRTFGSYYMDSANTEKYDGYKAVTDLMIGYDHGPHSFIFNMDNLFDNRYAADAKKSTSGTKTFVAASPRSVMLTYTYNF